MKKHAIIPLFIPNMGCPFNCVFCNQHTITATSGMIDSIEVVRMMTRRLEELEPLHLETVEAAFFGGSFTGLPGKVQEELLGAVLPYKQSGRIQKIRLSTRPDYIKPEILDRLHHYGVDIVELGIQSFDNDVLKQSARGHTAKDSIEACGKIRDAGFSLGIQLMIGLPGDTPDKSISSAKTAVLLKPDFVRIYPTVILSDTKLATMFQEGSFMPFTTTKAVETAKTMVRIFDDAGIPVIRLGLKSTDNISTAKDLAGGYHPAFRQLVEGAIAYDVMIAQLQSAGITRGTVQFSANPKSFSNLIGHHASNKKALHKLYPDIHFVYLSDQKLPEKKYRMLLLTSSSVD